MKIIASLFLIVAVSILLIGGLAALQAQTDIGDSVITNTSENYDQYQQVKNSTNTGMMVLGYSPLILVIFALALLGGFMLASVAIFKKL